MAVEAVVFDVDGTLVDSERHGHRVAFNDAFAAAGLPYRWDEETYGRLLATPGGERRLEAFLADDGVPEGERRTLVPRLHAHKTQRLLSMIDSGDLPARPGMRTLLEHLAGAGVRLGVATVGSPGWVQRLLARLFPAVTFDAVVTAADVTQEKPHPACYRLALDRLGIQPDAAVAIEDSTPGLRAALAAGTACVVVVNDYTADADFTGADLVLDGVDARAHVLADPHGARPSLPLDLEALERANGAHNRRR